MNETGSRDNAAETLDAESDVDRGTERTNKLTGFYLVLANDQSHHHAWQTVLRDMPIIASIEQSGHRLLYLMRTLADAGDPAPPAVMKAAYILALTVR